ncbi:beta-lactamase hydrolase domain-containing protein [Crateriforma conspicua]|uniref:Beta-lactamase hydrolase-like protein n=1 Tax=Crateriforma conspicua TaxID=2527996 RepID=A0A5C5XZ96_9PLAN|nr:protein tyrosine phosphatase family protein [Crateriforma conspicua]TWT68707.1 Beta-lactamase hydrolase-like protein [Crateriforma conspicua]
MSNRKQINDQITVSGQPSESEILALPSEGFRAVVNFRTSGEDDQPIDPDQERKMVESAGMKYVHVPVSMDTISHDTVDQFRQQLEALPKPVFAHCKSGKRAGAMTMMHVAVENDMSGVETLAKAEQMGFECDVPELKDLVKSYVDQRSDASTVQNGNASN